MAESIKAGAIADESLFAYIEGNADLLLHNDLPTLQEVIYRSVAFKARVVCADEREGGQRASLNFGHSIGHAIEAVMLPELLHGECVSIGMIEEAPPRQHPGAAHHRLHPPTGPVPVRLRSAHSTAVVVGVFSACAGGEDGCG